MTILLICDASIIEHIFTLVCKRLHINLTIQKTNSVNDNYDLIIIDQSFIDDKFNAIKQFSNKLGAISSEELPFEKSRDFIIPRPFLPTKLETIILEQIKYIKEEKEEENNNKRISFSKSSYEEEDNDVTVPVVHYIDSLKEDQEDFKRVSRKFEEEDDDYEEEDESIVHLQTLKSSGILDFGELNKINDILREDNIQNEINLEKNDWKDISSIIDDALEEVKEYEFDFPYAKGIYIINLHTNTGRQSIKVLK